MNWLTFSIVALCGIVSQTVLAGQFAFFGPSPDWMFALMVFVSLYSTRREAVVGAWVLGFLVDLTSVESLGVMSVGYVLVAMAVNGIRHLVFLKNAVTHCVVTFAAGVAFHSLLAGYHWLVWRDGINGIDILVNRGIGCVQTAAWAIVLHGALLRLRSVLGLATSAYSHSGLIRAEAHRV